VASRLYAQRQRIREAFATKEEAETHAAEIRVKVENEGAAAFSLPASVRVQAAEAVEKLTPFNAASVAMRINSGTCSPPMPNLS